jgi:hypothetical protein
LHCATDRAETKLFASFSRELLGEGCEIRIQARGASMSPAIRDGEIVYLKPAIAAGLRKGDIVLTNACGSFKLHRLLIADAARGVFITRGDCGQENDPAVGIEEILGVAVAKQVRVGRKIVRAKFNGVGGHVLRGMARVQSILSKILRLTQAGDRGSSSASSPCWRSFLPLHIPVARLLSMPRLTVMQNSRARAPRL